MDVREKLVELLQVDLSGSDGYEPELIADHLIANGVTVAYNLSPTEPLTNCQKWIPVAERLPESGEWVLCACRANIIEVLKYDSAMDDWDSTMPERCYMKGFVTHWMPLPEPPKEDT